MSSCRYGSLKTEKPTNVYLTKDIQNERAESTIKEKFKGLCSLQTNQFCLDAEKYDDGCAIADRTPQESGLSEPHRSCKFNKTSANQSLPTTKNVKFDTKATRASDETLVYTFNSEDDVGEIYATPSSDILDTSRRTRQRILPVIDFCQEHSIKSQPFTKQVLDRRDHNANSDIGKQSIALHVLKLPADDRIDFGLEGPEAHKNITKGKSQTINLIGFLENNKRHHNLIRVKSSTPFNVAERLPLETCLPDVNKYTRDNYFSVNYISKSGDCVEEINSNRRVYDSGNHTIINPASKKISESLWGSSKQIITLQRQKQYLSQDICPPMLEKSQSLQRLQNQSSTETSGFGETVTSGFTSQESIASYYSGACTSNLCHDHGIDLDEDNESVYKKNNCTLGTEIIDPGNTSNDAKERKTRNQYALSTQTGPRETHSEISVLPNNEFLKLGTSIDQVSSSNKNADSNHNAQMKEKHYKHARLVEPTEQLDVGILEPMEIRCKETNVSDVIEFEHLHSGPSFEELFQQSETFTIPKQTLGVEIDHTVNEWNKHKRGSSITSRSSQGSMRSRSGSTRRSKRCREPRESKWMQWGIDRRASFRRKMEQLERLQAEAPRASTPVKKARQEGLIFIHPDLESKYISEDDINYIKRHQQEKMKTYNVIDKTRKGKRHTTDRSVHDMSHLSSSELMALSRFWEHRVFVRTRYISILLSIVTTIIYVVSICSTRWVTYPASPDIRYDDDDELWHKCQPTYRDDIIENICDETVTRVSNDVHEGLWQRCRPIFKDDVVEEICDETITRDWQNAVICLMIFSAALGFIATILSICGICTSPLPKKIYYFHSAGEIFFVCALSSTLALLIYAVAISTDTSIHFQTYGSGYGLGCSGTAFFFATSFCMSLDELVRASAQNKCCQYICWRSRSNGDGNTHHV